MGNIRGRSKQSFLFPFRRLKKGYVGQENSGQATVEAAFVLPVLFIALLLLIQPAILLYDRMVMQAAAVEGCRLLATKTDIQGAMHDSCEAFIRHRLSAVPQQACFHVHEGQCSWDIAFEGNEGTESVTVRIAHKVRLLPLFGAGATLLGIADSEGAIPLEVTASLPTQPAWIGGTEAGRNPSAWIGSWLS